jgi:hypothetical protein
VRLGLNSSVEEYAWNGSYHVFIRNIYWRY